jgi:phosphate transport system substrate-binding protein
VLKFVEFYLDNAPRLSAEVGYIPLPDRVYQAAKQRVQKQQTGTSYHGDTPIADLLAK